MFYQDVIVMMHEDILIDKTALGKPSNPHFNENFRQGANNILIRGNETSDGNKYITSIRSNKRTIKAALPKRNAVVPKPEPTMTVEELVLIMESGIYTDSDGNIFYPEVYQFNPIIKVSIEDIDREIPEGLPNRTWINGSGPDNPVEIIHTWRTWRSSIETRPMELIEDYYYFISATFGDTLTGEELMIIHNDLYAELVDEKPMVNEII